MTSKKRRQAPPAAPARIPARRRGALAPEDHLLEPGAQGPNVGYWQAVGSTRSAAKRAKKP